MFALNQRAERQTIAREAAESKLAAVEAAEAAENLAANSQGLYSGLEGLTGEDLESEGYKQRSGISVQVLEADLEQFCLRVTNSVLVGDPWRTATYRSADQTLSPSDDC